MVLRIKKNNFKGMNGRKVNQVELNELGLAVVGVGGAHLHIASGYVLPVSVAATWGPLTNLNDQCLFCEITRPLSYLTAALLPGCGLRAFDHQ